jgi:hypothetical protein
MNTLKRKLTLVTGLPRSGTTVLGDILATAKSSTSLYEPMNFQSGDYRFDASFPVPGSADFSKSDLDCFLEDLRNCKLDLRLGIFPHDRWLKALGKIITGGRSRFSYLKSRLSPFSNNIVWKDPFALFCVDDVEEADIDVAVAYRPPEAIAASYKRLNWSFDTQNLCTRLLETQVGQEIVSTHALDLDLTAGISNPVKGAVFLWMTSARMILNSLNNGSELLLVSTGDLPNNPEATFQRIFDRLALQPTTKTHRTITQRFAIQENQQTVPTGHPHTRKRNLNSVNTYWKEVLTVRESEYVQLHCNELREQLEANLIPSKD